jgi:hypothetical protein
LVAFSCKLYLLIRRCHASEWICSLVVAFLVTNDSEGALPWDGRECWRDS